MVTPWVGVQDAWSADASARAQAWEVPRGSRHPRARMGVRGHGVGPVRRSGNPRLRVVKTRPEVKGAAAKEDDEDDEPPKTVSWATKLALLEAEGALEKMLALVRDMVEE